MSLTQEPVQPLELDPRLGDRVRVEALDGGRQTMTMSGCSTTSAGVPSATTRPRSRAIRRSAIELSSGRSCSMTSRLAPSSSRTRRSMGASASASRWAMPLEGSSSSSTVGPWASTQARSTTRRVPVDSSRTNLSR